MLKISNLLSSTLLFVTLASSAASGTVDAAQRMLNQLGYNAGKVDGAYGKKTLSALEHFYKDRGRAFDGELDTNEVSDLRLALQETGVGKFQYTALSGVEIENSHPVVKFPPFGPGITRHKYSGSYYWYNQDFNKDGLQDFIIVGEMKPKNLAEKGFNAYGNSANTCGGKDCKGTKYGPTLYLGQADGTFLDQSQLIIDNGIDPGMSLPRQTLIADFNGDGAPDIYIADTGFIYFGKDNGEIDKYYLSQPDGTWLESSGTHFSDSKLQLFDHGASAGDIDGDGDIDIVLTTGAQETVCWFNDGTGYLNKSRKCSNVDTTAIELADMDGDGDLDLIYGSRKLKNAGFLHNNGKGKFSKRITFSKIYKDWKVNPELSVWDLDNDGDKDVVISWTKDYYVGTAVEVIENLGKNKFKSEYFILSEAPVDVQKSINREGNEWNNFVDNIRFSDIDNDGDTDILLNSSFFKIDKASSIRGAVLLNNGNFGFEHVPQGDTRNKVEMLSKSAFISPKSEFAELTSQGAKTATKSVTTSASKKFTKFVKEQKVPRFNQYRFKPYEKPILLEKSGALIVGVENVTVMGKAFSYANVLVEWGGLSFPISVSIKTLNGEYTYFQVSLLKGKFLIDQNAYGFGQIGKFETLKKHCPDRGVLACFIDKHNLEKQKIDVGLLEFVIDLDQGAGMAVFVDAPVISDEDLQTFLTQFQ